MECGEQSRGPRPRKRRCGSPSRRPGRMERVSSHGSTSTTRAWRRSIFGSTRSGIPSSSSASSRIPTRWVRTTTPVLARSRSGSMDSQGRSKWSVHSSAASTIGSSLISAVSWPVSRGPPSMIASWLVSSVHCSRPILRGFHCSIPISWCAAGGRSLRRPRTSTIRA